VPVTSSCFPTRGFVVALLSIVVALADWLALGLLVGSALGIVSLIVTIRA
jgi:hypothetical protein